jgi:hypothetical protein
MAMPADPSDRIRRAASRKSTEELIKFWQKQDREHYSSASFEVVEEILKERGVSIESYQRKVKPEAAPRRGLRVSAGLGLIVLGGIEVLAVSLYFAIILLVILGVAMVAGSKPDSSLFNDFVNEILLPFWYLPALGVLVAISGLLVLLEIRYSEWIATVIVLVSAVVLAISFF